MCVKSRGLNALNKIACRVSSLCDISTGQLSTIPTLVTYMYIVSTGICVQVHVLIRLACVYQPLYDFWLNL